MATKSGNVEQYILSHVKLYNHHPVEDQQFLDFFPILSAPAALELVVSTFVSHILRTYDISQIAAIISPEAQGFIFGPLVASRLSLPSVPARKLGKLPGDVLRQKYGKWSGNDAFEIQCDAFANINTIGSDGRKKGVIIVDDSLASGGSAGAVKKLIERFGLPVLEGLFIIETTTPEFREKQRQCMGDLKTYGIVKLTKENWEQMPVHKGNGDKDENCDGTLHSKD